MIMLIMFVTVGENIVGTACRRDTAFIHIKTKGGRKI
jgi:hypothetical protein